MPQNVFMADQAMIPPLPGDAPLPVMPNPSQNQRLASPFGVPRFELVPKLIAGTWQNVEYVSIITPGDPKAMPRHKVTDAIRRMYPAEYKAFRDGMEMAPKGWPLEMWPVLNPAQVHHLKSLNIFTVEHIAQLADAHLHRIPMGRTLKNQAQAALRAKEESDGVESQRQQNELLKGSLAQMEDALAAMRAEMETLKAKATEPEPEKRRPGRPAKVAEPSHS